MPTTTKEVRTSELAVAQALATPYQRELLSRMPEGELRQVGEFAYPRADPAAGEDLGDLELRVGERTLTLPPREPTLSDALERLMKEPAIYARAWGRLYQEIDAANPTAAGASYWQSRMDRIITEELGYIRETAAGQERLFEGGRRDVEAEATTCPSCRLPAGFHADDCQSPAAREARGLEPIRPAPRRTR